MNNDRDLMQEALDALTYVGDKEIYSDTIDALRARLAQPEPLPAKSKGALSHEENKRHNQMIIDKFNAQQEKEPVAWWHDRGDVVDLNISGYGTPLYFAPPQRKWVGLTYADLYFWGGELGLGELGKGVLRAVDAHLREKNNG